MVRSTSGGHGRARTCDLHINSVLLYHSAILFVLLLGLLGLLWWHLSVLIMQKDHVFISSPVQIDNITNQPFDADEPIKFHFRGKRLTSSNPIVIRALVCKNATTQLEEVPATRSLVEVGDIDVTYSLTIKGMVLDGTNIPAGDTDCYISFKSVYNFPLPLGGYKELSVSYQSVPFSYTGKEGK